MKKILKGVVVALLLIVIVATMTACNKYKWGPVGSTKYASEEAVGNGSIAVKQGQYLYYVNGVDSSSLSIDSNKWGNASVKGSIMKTKINDDGTLDDSSTAVVVPKVFNSSYSEAGLYIYNSWIYYVARSMETDNKGNLKDSLEFLRTKIDGTKTQSIAIVSDLSSSYIFTKTGLLYTKNSEIHYVSYSQDKVGKEDKTVVSKYKEIIVSEEDLCIFYTKSLDSDYITATSLGVVSSDGKNRVIIDNDSYYTGTGKYYEDKSSLFTLKVIKYDASEDVIYYSKTCADAKAEVGTYGYKVTSGAFDKTKEVKFANKELSSIYPLGIDNGVLDVSSSKIKQYSKTNGKDIESDEVEFTDVITILFNEDSYTYFLMKSNLYRADLFKDNMVNKTATVEKISEEEVNTKYGNPVVIDSKMYYLSNKDSSYQYVMDYKTYSLDGYKATLAKGYIVSGYKTYKYAEDATFVVNKEDEKIKDKVPKFMIASDIETYVNNHKTENEE